MCSEAPHWFSRWIQWFEHWPAQRQVLTKALILHAYLGWVPPSDKHFGKELKLQNPELDPKLKSVTSCMISWLAQQIWSLAFQVSRGFQWFSALLALCRHAMSKSWMRRRSMARRGEPRCAKPDTVSHRSCPWKPHVKLRKKSQNLNPASGQDWLALRPFDNPARMEPHGTCFVFFWGSMRKQYLRFFLPDQARHAIKASEHPSNAPNLTLYRRIVGKQDNACLIYLRNT